MREIVGDVVVIGAGFGGSLMSLILHRIGLRPVLVDRGSHPRFAIGESSTPAADFVLRDLCRRYGLSELEPLVSFGSWRRTRPEVICGLKRGFSYFKHDRDQSFKASVEHSNELLVSASGSDFHADTHWLRSDVDAFFAAQVERNGIPYVDRFDAKLDQLAHGWELIGSRAVDDDSGRVKIRAKFAIDATGTGGAVLRTLGIKSDCEQMHTNSHAIFAHFEGVGRWADVMEQQNTRSTAEHPFPCDSSALHHVLDEGWMWQLRFENGISSAGFVVDGTGAQSIAASSRVPCDEWQDLMKPYPSIAQQFSGAAAVAPSGGICRTGRLQRVAERFAGDSWVALPHSAGFVDPLHSTGIAQTMVGIERLALAFEQSWNTSSFSERLGEYEDTVRAEFELIDQLVSGCYWTRSNFQAFAAQTMLYFAAATNFEHHRNSGRDGEPLSSGFLRADDPEFRQAIAKLHQISRQFAGRSRITDEQAAAFERTVKEELTPFDRVGLCDPTKRNMYRYDAR